MDIAELGLSVRSDGVVVATDRLDKMTGAANRTSTANERMTKQFDAMARKLKLLAAAGAAAMTAYATASIRAAVAAEETASKFQVVFRGSVERANDALVKLSRTIPLTVSDMRGLAAGVQDMLVPMGLAREAAADFSVEAVKLAGDLASFNNVGADQVLRDISSALAGQSEPLRKYGVDVSKARLETIALKEGLIGVDDEMTKSVEAQAIFIAVTQDSADAMGDAERTMKSTANQLKFLNRDFQQSKEDLGQALLPALNDLLTMLNTVNDDGVTPLQSGMRGLGEAILTGVSAFIIVKEAASLLGETLVGLGANVMHSLLAISAPFVEFLKTMSDAYAHLTAGEFSKAADAFDGLGKRISDGFQEHSQAASDALGFIGESLETRVGGALVTVSGLMNTFEDDIDRSLGESTVKMAEAGAAAEELGDSLKLSGEELSELADWWADLAAEIDPVAAATKEYEKNLLKLDKAIAAGVVPAKSRAKAVLQLKKNMEEAIGATTEWEKGLERIANIKLDSLDGLEKFAELKAMIDPAEAAMQRLSAALQDLKEAQDDIGFSDEVYDRMAEGLERAIMGAEGLGSALEQTGKLAGDVLRSIQSSMTNGSKEYEAMNVAIQATNVAQAIGAVLNQAQGDPYSAFARMAAMATAVAALGVSIGSFANAGQTDPTADRQATQGAGGVFGDAEAKSESILNATEITADATSELVGINRGMLNALRALQSGLSGASRQVIRNGADGSEIPVPAAESAWFTKSRGIGDLLGINFIGDFIGKLLGGKTKLLDTGLEITGGAITDLIGDVLVRAFADIKSKKWFGGKYKFSTIFEDLDDGIGEQFALVFGSIVDTVVEAAKAIGIPLDVIQSRLDEFEVATQKISLEGLSGEEQQEALLAVFSKIFDDLAMDIVPFIADFQQVGEGLGETLVRVATSVQVMQEGIKMLGLSLDDTDPEKFAQIAVGLIEMAGGIDEFISKLQNFVGKFATEEWRNNVAIEAVTRGFAQLGLALPETRDGLWELVQGLDLTTESGRANLAAILDLTDSLDLYYDIIEEGEAERLRMEQEAEAARIAEAEAEQRRIEEAAAARDAALNSEVQALLYIQSIAEGISDSLKALRDRIIGDTSTDEENYNRYKAEADALAAGLATMTDPDEIARTVAEIERLTGLAWGLLDEGQQQKMGDDFLAFLDGIEALALSRLGIAADDLVAGSEFTPEEILARFNTEVTDPLILVAGAQGMAAMKLDTAADKLLAATGAEFSLMADSDGSPIAVTASQPIPVNDTINTSAAIQEAVQAGMQAASDAIVAAAQSMSATGESSNNATLTSAQIISRAVNSIPARIVVQTTSSEYS